MVNNKKHGFVMCSYENYQTIFLLNLFVLYVN